LYENVGVEILYTCIYIYQSRRDLNPSYADA
jgi:hypothetical protein